MSNLRNRLANMDKKINKYKPFKRKASKNFQIVNVEWTGESYGLLFDVKYIGQLTADELNEVKEFYGPDGEGMDEPANTPNTLDVEKMVIDYIKKNYQTDYDINGWLIMELREGDHPGIEELENKKEFIDSDNKLSPKAKKIAEDFIKNDLLPGEFGGWFGINFID